MPNGILGLKLLVDVLQHVTLSVDEGEEFENSRGAPTRRIEPLKYPALPFTKASSHLRDNILSYTSTNLDPFDSAAAGNGEESSRSASVQEAPHLEHNATEDASSEPEKVVKAPVSQIQAFKNVIAKRKAKQRQELSRKRPWHKRWSKGSVSKSIGKSARKSQTRRKSAKA